MPLPLKVIDGEQLPRPDERGYLNPNAISTDDWRAFARACDTFAEVPISDIRLTIAVSDLIEISTEVVNIPSLRLVKT